MHKVLGIVAALTLGWLILLWYALAYGATAFPFTHTGQPFGPNWTPVGETSTGRCESGNFVMFRLASQDQRTGWQIFYSSNEKVVAVRFAIDPEGKGTPDLIVFALVKEQGRLEFWGERVFDRDLDTGPCGWIDAKAT